MRRVDDGGKVRDVEHAQVRDGEGTALVLLRCELAVTRLLCERLGFGGEGCEALGADVLYDGRDEAIGRRDGDADVDLVVPSIFRQLLDI